MSKTLPAEVPSSKSPDKAQAPALCASWAAFRRRSTFLVSNSLAFLRAWTEVSSSSKMDCLRQVRFVAKQIRAKKAPFATPLAELWFEPAFGYYCLHSVRAVLGDVHVDSHAPFLRVPALDSVTGPVKRLQGSSRAARGQLELLLHAKADDPSIDNSETRLRLKTTIDANQSSERTVACGGVQNSARASAISLATGRGSIL